MLLEWTAEACLQWNPIQPTVEVVYSGVLSTLGASLIYNRGSSSLPWRRVYAVYNPVSSSLKW
eukprot:2924453-Lingulodinium_polyedra.AAC.1